MLRSIKEIIGYKLKAFDGEIGKCKDFLIDSKKWVVRYMVADTGNWLPGRQVLISPVSLEQPSWADKILPVSLKKTKIESAPGLDQDAPVSRQWEIDFYEYYGWPYYWTGSHLWGRRATPRSLQEEILKDHPEESGHDSDLRSFNEVHDYKVVAKDKKYGIIHDFIVNDRDWEVRQIIVDTGSWFFGKKVLVATGYVENINYFNKEVMLNVSSEQLKDFPEYDSGSPVNLKVESVSYDFKGRPHVQK